MEPRSISEHIAATEKAEGKAECCIMCKAEFGLGLTQERRAVGLNNVCLSCAQMMEADATFDERPIYHSDIEAYP